MHLHQFSNLKKCIISFSPQKQANTRDLLQVTVLDVLSNILTSTTHNIQQVHSDQHLKWGLIGDTAIWFFSLVEEEGIHPHLQIFFAMSNRLGDNLLLKCTLYRNGCIAHSQHSFPRAEVFFGGVFQGTAIFTDERGWAVRKTLNGEHWLFHIININSFFKHKIFMFFSLALLGDFITWDNRQKFQTTMPLQSLMKMQTSLTYSARHIKFLSLK